MSNWYFWNFLKVSQRTIKKFFNFFLLFLLKNIRIYLLFWLSFNWDVFWKIFLRGIISDPFPSHLFFFLWYSGNFYRIEMLDLFECHVALNTTITPIILLIFMRLYIDELSLHALYSYQEELLWGLNFSIRRTVHWFLISLWLMRVIHLFCLLKLV